jgi:phenylacetate-CoA ligase
MAGFIQDKIYPKLPLFAQNLAISIFGYFWQKRRFGGVFDSELIEFRNREKFTAQQWENYQTQELRKLIISAFVNVPLYNEKYSKAGFCLNDFENFELADLSKLPYLEKDELRLFGTTTLLSLKKDKKGVFFSSSGSTGTPTRIYFSETMHQKWSAAFESRIRNWANLSIKDARGMIGGRRVISMADAKPPFYRFNSFERQVYFSAYHINAKNAIDYLEGMQKHHIKYMTGYAMSNYLLARFVEQSGLKAPKLQAVITSSEKLTQEMRDTFKRVYDCKTYDSYSGLEACGLISECEFGKLHVSPDVGYIEFIKDDGSYALPGESGEMICTGFLNYDQPLIRYRIGDVAKLSLNQTCECKRTMPIVEEIIGRTEDVITGADGRKMVRFHGVFLDIPSIVEGQIIQHSLTGFEIKVVLNKQLTNEEKQCMHERMESQLGNVDVTINEVDSIPRMPSGKFKAVISHVSNS